MCLGHCSISVLRNRSWISDQLRRHPTCQSSSEMRSPLLLLLLAGSEALRPLLHARQARTGLAAVKWSPNNMGKSQKKGLKWFWKPSSVPAPPKPSSPTPRNTLHVVPHDSADTPQSQEPTIVESEKQSSGLGRWPPEVNADAITESVKMSDVISAIAPVEPAPPSRKTPDGLAALSLIGATATQATLIISFLHLVQLRLLPLLEKLVGSSPRIPKSLPTVVVAALFAFLSLRSRVFSPLDNSRPSASRDDPVFKERLRPWWQPPPIAFPIIWSTISLLRTISSVLVWRTTGTLLCTPIFAFLLHLSIGDTWNTINNVEKRLGTAVLGALFVLASVLHSTYLYYQTLPLAGLVLAPSCIWLTIANVLVFSIWRLNLQLFDRPSLFPSKEEGPPSKWRLPLTTFRS